MKSVMVRLLAVLLFCVSLLSLAEASIVNLAGFTHPEIGEFIVFIEEDGKPFFTIYDFLQYKIMPPTNHYRGIDLSDKKKIQSIEATLNTFFDSIEKLSDEAIPKLFEFEGVLADYGYLLELLSREDKIQAIRLIAGFDGIKGFSLLKKINGLESVDISYLEETYEDYTINLSGKSYPYRVLMFYIEEEDWLESYYERYAYIKDGRKWKLVQITKEYSGEYRQRNKYIHGLSNNMPSIYDQVTHDALRGHTWFSLHEDVSNLENAVFDGNQINVLKTTVFRLPADLTFTYNKKNWLSAIEYRLQSHEAFYSAFVSLYMRYYDPTENSGNRFTWSLPDTLIELSFDQDIPIIRFTPRFDQSKVSSG